MTHVGLLTVTGWQPDVLTGREWPMADDVYLLTPEQVQQRLAISERTMFRMLDDDELEGYMVRGSIRFRSDYIDSFIDGLTPRRKRR